MNEQELCLKLLHSNSEEEVVKLLNDCGYWNDRDSWRYFGDLENNWSTIGNQQSSPHAALVEKLVNAVDATLMGLCYEQGYSPDSDQAPGSMRSAVARFFEEGEEDAAHAGLIRNWTNKKRTDVASRITLVATGSKMTPCFSIADCGEGQTPDTMPDTLLSLTRSNKLRIPFVQGKFNMGGTGVFKFCGKQNIQLVISKKNPKALQGYSQDAGKWGFTVVRREDPERGRRSSVFTYLAPLGKESLPGKGGVLRFGSSSMPLFPEFSKDNKLPYGREAEWGTLIKLFEYSLPSGARSNILLKDGLLRRTDLLLPDTALPIRFYEGRKYQGHAGSSSNTLTGLSVRLEDDKTNNLEEGYPTSCPLKAADEEMTATIYAFKKGKAKTYRNDEGIIFTLNGQTHGYLTPDFFRRRKTGMSYLADSLLVVVDCSRFSGRAREDLFMNSRDRLSKGGLRAAIERELEDMLKNHVGLRNLREQRQFEATQSKLEDAKPLEDVLKSIIKNAPNLANLFLLGKRANNPFKTKQVREDDKPFEGQRFPTYFKFRGKDEGVELRRETCKNMRTRISFETDVVNDYFSRSIETGEFSLIEVCSDGSRKNVAGYVGPNLHNGVATLSVNIPETAKVGDELYFESVVKDGASPNEFTNRFKVVVKPESDASGGNGKRKKPPGNKQGDNRENTSGIALPNIIEVKESDWDDHDFTKHTALKIKNAGGSEAKDSSGTSEQYDFFVNVDNVYLNADLKSSKTNYAVIQARFTYGIVLIGLGLLQQYTEDAKHRNVDDDDDEPGNIEELVERVSRSIAPVILPMIESLGGINVQELEELTASGEAV